MTTIQQPVPQHQIVESTPLVDENVNIATVSDGGRELSKTILYVGNVHNTISEEQLTELFSSVCPIKSIKVLHDKNKQGFNYSFVEFETNEEAQSVFNALNDTVLDDYPLRITWAFQTQQLQETETFNLFIGDLSLEVNDEILTKTFSQFPSFIQANVMWDMKTGRSRGYGFVNFKDRTDAENVLQTMNGVVLGDRPIRLNWATHKQQQNNNNNNNRFNRHNFNINNQNHNINNNNNNQQQVQQQQHLPPHHNGMLAPMILNHNMNQPQHASIPQLLGPQSYDMILRQTPNWLTVVYLGNLAHFTTQNDLIPLLQNFGYIVNFKLMADKGCAFVTYDTHERATMAIVQLTGFTINGRPLKCGWGKQGKIINRTDSPQLRV